VALAPRDLPVLGADTIVILNGEVLKPRDAEHAANAAQTVGQTHQVMTAVALADSQHAGLPGGDGSDVQSAYR
jgi:septum formation protein